MKILPILLTAAILVYGCHSPKTENENKNEDANLKTTEIAPPPDTLPPPAPPEDITPRELVVGFEELDIFFYDWPQTFTLNYPGYPIDGSFYDATRFEIRDDHSRVCKIEAKVWSHVESLAIGESPYTVGKVPAYRTVLPDGKLRYSFETDGKGYGWIVGITELKPAYENWLKRSYSSTINEQTDSLVSLVSSPFPLQVPQVNQKIGVTFREETYHDGSFPRTKIWISLTNFSNLITNSAMVADAIGAVENTTEGKPTLDEGEQLVLKNFYAGLNTQWVLVNEATRLVLYERTEDEPSMDTETETGHSKEILVLPVDERYNFTFVGYFPMSE